MVEQSPKTEVHQDEEACFEFLYFAKMFHLINVRLPITSRAMNKPKTLLAV
jgi:hypothetical protein